ncbi:hypothetical protein HTG_07450 [Natrinema mahii]|nr:hypothetical protein HTG_07450 [Natrinema mahii]
MDLPEHSVELIVVFVFGNVLISIVDLAATFVSYSSVFDAKFFSYIFFLGVPNIAEFA